MTLRCIEMYRIRSRKAIRSTILMIKAFFPRNTSEPERSARKTIEISVQTAIALGPTPYTSQVTHDLNRMLL